jgi:adenosine deaminase
MVRAGLNVSFSTDDAVFFRTSLAREFQEALPALGLGLAEARAISVAGISGAFCDDDTKASLLARFRGEIAALDAALTA